mgnify:CR=1 FL=1
MQGTMFGAAVSSFILGSLLSTAAWADHMSIHGEGWANMPNDIHNTRIDTRLSGDSEAFKDFVRMGAGADSVNRYLDTTSVRGNQAMGGNVRLDAMRGATRR